MKRVKRARCACSLHAYESHTQCVMVLTKHTVQAPIAHPSLDIWALGVLLYEICSSQHLFPRNFTNDNVTDPAVKCRLCTWHTMSDEALKEVYEQLVNKGT